MSLVQTVTAFVVALGVLIVVHEYGHYLAARLCGVKVLRFSVGFGRRLAAWRSGRDGTEWVLAAIPFGGYVKMLDEREGPVAPADAARAFNRQSVWRRLFIVAAGPAANFLFAIAAYAALFMYGLPEARPVLAEPPGGSIAAVAGLRAGDIVRSVDGRAVATWQELRWRVLQGALQREALRVETISDRGHIAGVLLDLRAVSPAEVEGDVLERLGLRLLRPKFDPVIGDIALGSPAQRAGLMPGDRIMQVQAESIASWEAFVKVIQQSPRRTITLTVERGAQRLKIPVTPDAVQAGGMQIGRIGAAPKDLESLYLTVSYGPADSLAKAVERTVEIAVFTLRVLGKMLIGELSWKHLSGPVTIADYAGQSAQMGWISYLTFLALISISLGVLNLLPIPLLDGGHLLYYAIEIITGSPVSERAMELGQRVGLALLLVMMAFAFYNDLNRLFTG